MDVARRQLELSQGGPKDLRLSCSLAVLCRSLVPPHFNTITSPLPSPHPILAALVSKPPPTPPDPPSPSPPTCCAPTTIAPVGQAIFQPQSTNWDTISKKSFILLASSNCYKCFVRQRPEDGLAKFRSKYSPARPEQHSYPSPPMSESHSPARRSAQTSEAVRPSYPPNVGATQRQEAGLPLLPPSSSLLEPRSLVDAHGHAHHRSMYPGESQHRAGHLLRYQPPHPTEHHPYGHVAVSHTSGYGFTSHMNPYAPGAHLGGPMVQHAALIPPPSVRPNKPARRTKAHVASACVNCKKAHLSCDVQRPCGRCVSSGKQDSCKDVQHKKRGRPRLRDDREFIRPEEGRPSQSQLPGTFVAPDEFVHQPHFAASSAHRTSDQELVMRSTGPRSEFANARSNIAPLSERGHSGLSGSVGVTPSSYSAGPNLAYHCLPVAFLNLDLVIQKSNQAFADLVSFLGDAKGKHLGDLLEARQNESLQRLRNELRDERDEREPAYMAPITPIGHDPMHAVMDTVADYDVDHVSQGFTARSMFLSFRLPGTGQYQSLQVQVRLAKTSLYFVTMVVRSPPRHNVPSILPQKLVTPTRAMHQASGDQFTSRPTSSTSTAPSSPFFNFASIRTSLPALSPSSYGGSPSYAYSPTPSQDSGYLPTTQPRSSHPTSTYPSPYTSGSRKPPATSEPAQDLARPARLEGLHLPPIRTTATTSAAPLGSPLHAETGLPAPLRTESDRLRHREVLGVAEQRRPATPESGKRRRLNIHEVLD
ncbi:hypothetical protein IAQ61_005860 [Plenodomus lingam]|uniref:uncharacterized protein n=1 Tax=Leptosphaeria maculans TaxID=5022 RepID=UPI003319EEC1|nr:hypothetical protein IAQ61_005860 [Plenodomus lingam]